MSIRGGQWVSGTFRTELLASVKGQIDSRIACVLANPVISLELGKGFTDHLFPDSSGSPLFLFPSLSFTPLSSLPQAPGSVLQ